MKQQMALGSFIFGLSRNFAYHQLLRKSDGGWTEIQILTSKPKSSQTGQKPETLTITGKSMYAVAMDRLDELRKGEHDDDRRHLQRGRPVAEGGGQARQGRRRRRPDPALARHETDAL